MSFKILTDYLENEVNDLAEKMEVLTTSDPTPLPQTPYNGTVYFGGEIPDHTMYSDWSNDRLIGSHIFKTADRIQGICALTDNFCEYFEYEFDPLLGVFDLCRIFGLEIVRKSQEVDSIMTIDEKTGAIDFPPFETADLQNRKLFNVKINCQGERSLCLQGRARLPQVGASVIKMGPHQKLENIKYIQNKSPGPKKSISDLYSAYNVVNVGDYFWRPHEIDDEIAAAASKKADAILGINI